MYRVFGSLYHDSANHACFFALRGSTTSGREGKVLSNCIQAVWPTTPRHHSVISRAALGCGACEEMLWAVKIVGVGSGLTQRTGAPFRYSRFMSVEVASSPIAYWPAA